MLSGVYQWYYFMAEALWATCQDVMRNRGENAVDMNLEPGYVFRVFYR